MIRQWSKTPSYDLRDYLIEALGIPQSDFRRVRWINEYDAVEVQLWNRRNIIVTGLEMFKWLRARSNSHRKL